VDNYGGSNIGSFVMNLFQHANFTALRSDLTTAQLRCQTRRIHQIQRELKDLVTNILRDENNENLKLKKENK
tara:strand:+ start:1398 stop:1613 length:216 start_codon:yes stop_codon:yes gene_type:complete